MKNHFYIAYCGNKREEVKIIYDNIDFTNIENVIEPYCGSASMSYYLWTKNPNLKFVLNDNNRFLKEIFEIIKDDNKCLEFENTINKMRLKVIELGKEEYVKYSKNKKDIHNWLFIHKYFKISPGLYPADRPCLNNIFKFSNYPIYNFYKTANIEFYDIDAIEIYEKYKSKKHNLILIDPPYILTCNDFYTNHSMNIYEYFDNNNINKEKAKIKIILEKNWIINLLFKKNKCFDYEKIYNGLRKKKVIHTIIYN